MTLKWIAGGLRLPLPGELHVRGARGGVGGGGVLCIMERRASPGTEGDARKPPVAIVVVQCFLYAAGLYSGKGWLSADESSNANTFDDKQNVMEFWLMTYCNSYAESPPCISRLKSVITTVTRDDKDLREI